MPTTPVAGWRALAYYDPLAKAGGRPKLVGHHPCAVFGTAAPDGRSHARRVYLAAGGAGKAELGARPDGRRDPKKSVRISASKAASSSSSVAA